jgi:outer membrane protein OmpU
VGWAEQESNFERATATRYKNFDVKSDADFYFRGSVKLDNGIEVSVDAQIENQRSSPGTTGDLWDETYMKISGGFGDVYLGATDGVTTRLIVSAPFAGALNPYTSDEAAWIVQPDGGGANGFRGPTSQSGANDFNRVSYVTPSLFGFRLGAGYMPASDAANEDQPTVAAVDIWDVAAQYSEKFGDIGVRGSVGYWRSEGTSSTAQTDNYTVGADFTFADITVGGGYMWAEADAATVAGASSEGKNWNAGIRYAPGPFAVALTYMRGERDDTGADPDDTKVTRWKLGANYTLGPGVDLIGTAIHHNWKDEADTDATNNKGWAVVGGIAVSF